MTPTVRSEERLSSLMQEKVMAGDMKHSSISETTPPVSNEQVEFISQVVDDGDEQRLPTTADAKANLAQQNRKAS